MDFHALVLTGDLLSNDIQIDDVGVVSGGGELSVGAGDLNTLGLPALQNSSYNDLNVNFNLICGGAYSLLKEKTFETTLNSKSHCCGPGISRP
ncbi:hypothetical protein Tco_0064304 [Tanacetum coccineum]